MSIYARFRRDLRSEEFGVHYKKNDGSKNTRYCVVGESDKKFFIAKKPNDIDCTECCSFDVTYNGVTFDMDDEVDSLAGDEYKCLNCDCIFSVNVGDDYLVEHCPSCGCADLEYM